MSSDEKYSCYAQVFFYYLSLLNALLLCMCYAMRCIQWRCNKMECTVHTAHKTYNTPQQIHYTAFMESYELNANNYINGCASIIHAFRLVWTFLFIRSHQIFHKQNYFHHLFWNFGLLFHHK